MNEETVRPLAAPLLTFYTPTFRRPKALAACRASLACQKDQDFQHAVIEDLVGLGVDGMFRDICNHLDAVHGQYVVVLSDDDAIADERVVGDFRDFITGRTEPVVIWKKDRCGRVLPDLWCSQPREGHIDLGCWAVRSDIWKANARRWGPRYAGDFDFIDTMWVKGHPFAWMDRLAMVAQRVSEGRPE